MRAQDVYGDWLDGYDWTHWATLTFSRAPTLAGARRWTERALEKHGVHSAFWATEKGYYGRWHVHALLDCERRDGLSVVRARLEPSAAADETAQALATWWRRHLGIERTERYDPGRGAVSYVSKYVTKSLSDYDWWARQTP